MCAPLAVKFGIINTSEQIMTSNLPDPSPMYGLELYRAFSNNTQSFLRKALLENLSHND